MTDSALRTESPATEAGSKALSILFLGPDTLTSGHRASALKRLGHEVQVVDTRLGLSKNSFLNRCNYQIGFRILGSIWQRRMLDLIPPGHFDLVFVGSADLLGPDLVSTLKRRYGTVVAYVIDDPFGNRDGQRWRLFLESISLYDLVVVVRDCNVAEARSAGATRVLRVTMAADEVAHSPGELTKEDIMKWQSDVAFIGTWMPERGPFLARLAEFGVPLSIYGNRWQRAPEWSTLRGLWRGPALDNDHDYPRAVQCAKICIGLLSKGNRDLSTTRSFEIPYLGGLLCAERTVEHEALYTDGEEAVFWSTPEECAEICKLLLADTPARLRIAENGRLRCIRNKTTNQSVLAEILAAAQPSRP